MIILFLFHLARRSSFNNDFPARQVSVKYPANAQQVLIATSNRMSTSVSYAHDATPLLYHHTFMTSLYDQQQTSILCTESFSAFHTRHMNDHVSLDCGISYAITSFYSTLSARTKGQPLIYAALYFSTPSYTIKLMHRGA